MLSNLYFLFNCMILKIDSKAQKLDERDGAADDGGMKIFLLPLSARVSDLPKNIMLMEFQNL